MQQSASDSVEHCLELTPKCVLLTDRASLMHQHHIVWVWSCLGSLVGFLQFCIFLALKAGIGLYMRGEVTLLGL